MELPIELFALFIGSSIALALFGFLRNPQIPAMLTFGGIFILFISISTTSIIMGQLEQEQLNFEIQEIYHLHNWNADRSIFLGANEARAIFIDPDSFLVSDSWFNRLDCVQFPIKKLGNPTGNATIAVFDDNADVQPIQFGTIDVSTLNTDYDWYEFCLPENFHHFIEPFDRIGIKYNDASSDASNHILIPVDTTDPIDTNIFMQRFISGSWVSDTPIDMTAVLYNRATSEELIYIDDSFEFTELPKTIFALLGAIFMLSGALMVFRGER